MRYLGLDVHTAATVWCQLDGGGEVKARGKEPTTAPALTALVRRLSEDEELLVGQEVGKMSTFVHDVVTAAQVRQVEATIRREASSIDAIRRLKTIPAVGDWVSVSIYAWVGDVSRFPNARSLAAYAGLVPSVWQSGTSERSGGITKQGSPALRRMLTQAGHVLLWRCRSVEAAPLKAIPMRVHTARKRRKIAVVAAARHILRIAYYVLRDGTVYDPARLAAAEPAAAE